MTAAVFCYDVVMVLECMSEEDWQIIRQGKPEIFTTISLFSDCAEYLHPGFNADVARYADLISRQGVII